MPAVILCACACTSGQAWALVGLKVLLCSSHSAHPASPVQSKGCAWHRMTEESLPDMPSPCYPAGWWMKPWRSCPPSLIHSWRPLFGRWACCGARGACACASARCVHCWQRRRRAWPGLLPKRMAAPPHMRQGSGWRRLPVYCCTATAERRGGGCSGCCRRSRRGWVVVVVVSMLLQQARWRPPCQLRGPGGVPPPLVLLPWYSYAACMH